MNLLNTCVRIDDEQTLNELRALLEEHGELIDEANFRTFGDKQLNFAAKWRLDGIWRIGNSERQRVPIWKIREILTPKKHKIE